MNVTGNAIHQNVMTMLQVQYRQFHSNADQQCTMSSCYVPLQFCHLSYKLPVAIKALQLPGALLSPLCAHGCVLQRWHIIKSLSSSIALKAVNIKTIIRVCFWHVRPSTMPLISSLYSRVQFVP